ncbi:MAG: deoxyguanosinetriphosphate triphosphohydrolase [Nitrospinae bacterium]|nr:deoxyguanosinetriphosphate triphosphohydrolase [Nitrospinota bacterium]
MARSRDDTERLEDQLLAPYASKTRDSRGRRHPEEEHPYRTIYMRDRDRVIHSGAFRRLEYKTQVFVYHEGDHYRTRLTHTIEVSQIARSMARALHLNEDLCEAMALSHDLGHPPFGHSGERALDILMKDHGGFEHNAHAMRIVDHIENRYPEFRGLNLTWETREAIARHSKRPDNPMFAEFMGFPHPSIEAQVADIADEIAYNSHDLDDGLESGLLKEDALNDTALWKRFYGEIPSEFKITKRHARYHMIRKIINAQVSDAVFHTESEIERHSITSPDGARNCKEHSCGFSDEMSKDHMELKKFLRDNMYKSYRVIRMEEKAHEIVTRLFEKYAHRPEILPPRVQRQLEFEDRSRLICDYIAGMTDKYALEEYQKLFDPMSKV